MNERTQARICHNEALFRVVNEEISQLVPRTARTFEIVCECGDPDCRALISVISEAYAEVRAEPTRFFVRPDHQIDEVEEVVGVHEGHSPLGTYLVVEKRQGVAELAADLQDRRG